MLVVQASAFDERFKLEIGPKRRASSYDSVGHAIATVRGMIKDEK